ncbi:nuclear transport factor 2 family protein [Hymenobacter sp.]|uniref:nuclear transport factor 2 family protein n=1 Tax=Hymenobacter sp. TaxID=1898978 RepID=UPI00286A9AEC|nr:nuclear transport factor 2 family protein [Hymenobacter sp.]
MQTASNTDQAQVLQLHSQLLVAVAARDEATLEKRLNSGFVFTSANAEVLTKAGFIKGFAMNSAIQLPVFAGSEQRVTIEGGTAVVTAVLHISIISGKMPARELWERITETYVKEQGQWSLLASHATYRPL